MQPHPSLGPVCAESEGPATYIGRPPMQPALLDPAQAHAAHILVRLQSDVIAWFGSVRPDGRPHLVPVWFLWEQGTILVFSQPNQKVRNIERNPSVILALDDTHDGEDVIE